MIFELGSKCDSPRIIYVLTMHKIGVMCMLRMTVKIKAKAKKKTASLLTHNIIYYNIIIYISTITMIIQI